MTTIQRSITTSQPASEPLSLSEAKRHLGIADVETGHDRHVTDLIKSARELWEYDTQTATTTRTIVEKLDRWPDECWRFYYRPVSSVTSVEYYDSGNTLQTLATSVYDLDAGNRHLLLKVDQDWPDTETRWDAITITYVAGQSTLGEIPKSAMKLQLDILFESRGMTKEKDLCVRSYENLVKRFQRGSYP